MSCKQGKFFIGVFVALGLCACNNFFHDLIPPDGDRIESFSIKGQTGIVIGDNDITVIVPPGTALDGLVPSVRVSHKATLIPVTYEYVSRAFKDDNTFGAAMEIYAGGNMTEKVVEMIREKKTFESPVIDLPINFGYPVDFLVISGIGTIRQYRVHVEEGDGKFTAFRFERFYNPDLVRGAIGEVYNGTKTVTVDVSYPVENIASYKLIPTFATNGARAYLDGKELRSGESLMNFLKPPVSDDLNNPPYSQQTKKLTLKQPGYADAV
jgi:hypothetical protein